MVSSAIMAGLVAGYSPFVVKRMIRFDASALVVIATYLTCVIIGFIMLGHNGMFSGTRETVFTVSAFAGFFLTIVFRIT